MLFNLLLIVSGMLAVTLVIPVLLMQAAIYRIAQNISMLDILETMETMNIYTFQ